MRLRGFLKKETLQIRRDPSSVALAIIMPVVLLVIFGYGVSLDPRDVPIAVVMNDGSPEAEDVLARLELSRYFDVIRVAGMADAERMVEAGEADGMVRIREGFSEHLHRDEAAPVQLIVNGVDANRARLIQGYVAGAVGNFPDVMQARGEPATPPPVELGSRTWFNESAESTNFLVPGLLTLIMTLIGTLLTALVIAREWERGTMEALLATPLRSGEILLGKMLPYFVLGMGGMSLSVVLGVLLFGVPLRGSLLLLGALGGLFMLASLGLGLAISATVRDQFVAAQISIIAGFLPAFFLSGLLFDLGAAPHAIRVISHVVPARYFVTISQTLFMAGDIPSVLLPAGAVLAGMALLLLTVTRLKLSPRLPRS